MWGVGGCWSCVGGEGRRPGSQLAPTSTQPHLRSGDQLNVQDLAVQLCKISGVEDLGEGVVLSVANELCEDKVAKAIPIEPH